MATFTEVKTLVLSTDLKIVIGTMAFDNSYPTGGEAIANITDNFSYVYGGVHINNDTVADNGWRLNIVSPGIGTACTTSNVLITAFVTGAAQGAVSEEDANATDMSSVGAAGFILFGK